MHEVYRCHSNKQMCKRKGSTCIRITKHCMYSRENLKNTQQDYITRYLLILRDQIQDNKWTRSLNDMVPLSIVFALYRFEKSKNKTKIKAKGFFLRNGRFKLHIIHFRQKHKPGQYFVIFAMNEIARPGIQSCNKLHFSVLVNSTENPDN